MNPVAFTKPADTATASIVIPVFRDLGGLTDTIASILDCAPVEGTQREVVVVNDGADPGISAYCREKQLIEVSITPNRGPYYARNRGIEQTSGACIGFVDADIFVDRQWIARALGCLQDYDYVGGNICVLRHGVSRIVADYQQFVDFNTRWHMETIRYAPTANVWMRRAVIEMVGGFNESLFSGGDMEFGRRVHQASGLRTHYAEDMVVSHPPRDFRGLLAKSKRLAYGHSVIGRGVGLESEFTLMQSLRRNFARSAATEDMPARVYLLRALLFAHRAVYKGYYRFARKNLDFRTAVSTSNDSTKVCLLDHR